MVKKILLFLFLVILIVPGSIYYLLNSAWFLEKIIPVALNRQFPDIQIEELRIGKQQFTLPGHLSLKNVQYVILQDDEKYAVFQEKMDIRFYGFKKQIMLKVQGGAVQSSAITLKDADIFLNVASDEGETFHTDGKLRILSAVSQRYKLTNIRSKISGDGQRIYFKDFLADCYGGKVTGEIFLDYKPDISYSIETKLSDLDLVLMRRANEQIFSNVTGKVSGTLVVKGTPEKIESVKASLDAPGGGELRASLLKNLLEYIPPTTQKEDLKALMKTGGNIPLQKATIDLESVSDEKLVTDIGLASQTFNLNANVTVEINVEGGFKNLLEHLQKALQQ